MARHAGLLLAGWLLSACSGTEHHGAAEREGAATSPDGAEAPAGGEPIDQSQQCIVGGGPSAAYLKLEPEQLRALVQVRVTGGDASHESSSTCSGVLIADRWVLSAAHCAAVSELNRATVHFGSETGDCAGHTFQSLSVLRHPSLDLLLVELDASTSEHPIGAAPIRVADRDRLELGHLVQLAGFGWTESSEPGTLRFAVEPVSQIAAGAIVVDGASASGACTGDSGGPLLVRDANGAVVVAGILSRGSSDCIGLDEYVRLGAAREWLTASVGDELASAEPGCQALGHEGGCFDGVAAWCTTGGDLDAEQCEAGSSCGWSDAASGFRCRGDGEGACGNVTAVGECDDNVALRCEHGELVQEVCATCSRSPQDGRVTCASPRE